MNLLTLTVGQDIEPAVYGGLWVGPESPIPNTRRWSTCCRPWR